MAPDDIKKWITRKGYSMTSRTGDWLSASYAKEIIDPLTEQAIVIHCTIFFSMKRCALIGYPKIAPFFEVNTGWFSAGHPRFDDQFERRLADILFRLNEASQ